MQGGRGLARGVVRPLRSARLQTRAGGCRVPCWRMEGSLAARVRCHCAPCFRAWGRVNPWMVAWARTRSTSIPRYGPGVVRGASCGDGCRRVVGQEIGLVGAVAAWFTVRFPWQGSPETSHDGSGLRIASRNGAVPLAVLRLAGGDRVGEAQLSCGLSGERPGDTHADVAGGSWASVIRASRSREARPTSGRPE